MSELTRRDLLVKGMGAAAAASAAYALRGPATALLSGTARASTAAPTTAWNHDPGSPIGPYHWGEIDPGFSVRGPGMHQSPVSIETARARILHGPPLRLSYDASELAIENTGHVVEVMIPPGVEDVLQIGGDRYTLTQYHFHAPSEHVVNGRRADVEAHFVHTNAAGDAAVVGVFFRIGPRPNALLEKLLRRAPETSGAEGRPIGEAIPPTCSATSTGRARSTDRCTSARITATTVHSPPPVAPRTCAGRWCPMAGMSPRQAVARFHRVIAKFAGYGGYPNNNRPVRPLDERVIELHR